ncbi:MAG: saccharopine dehydrogenase NADP-binding domain-containing protein [Actinobacteria bacterium]|nr:saccharopine dehydrogenase NADP-binding domain-containing protein [Actinomycetota bacterium]
MSGFRYGVLGAGRQGTAAAYDLAVRGGSASVALADLDGASAERAAQRVNALAGEPVASGEALDVSDPRALRDFLEPLHAAVSAVPYGLNLGVAEAAVDAGTHVCDLGGNTPIVLRELELDPRARERGVAVVPDCGEAPGLANNLVAHALTLLDEPEEAVLYDGGLPLDPRPPWSYALTFNIDGLTNEYHGTTTYVIDGEPREVECLDPAEDELVEFPEPFGTLEAFAANTGSTTPWTLGRRLRTLKSKVLRYPGHVARFRAFRDAGLFSLDPVVVGGVEVVPREVLHALLEPRIRATPKTRDVVLNRVVVRGRHDGSDAEAVVDLVVRHDEELGFTAMERATGWHAAIVCHLMASGVIGAGARPVEVAVEPARIVEAVRARGFELAERVAPA